VGFEEKATRVDEQPLDFKPGDSLELDATAGSINVQASASSKPRVRARITAFGHDVAEAQRNLEKCQLKIERVSSGVRVRVECESMESRSANVTVRMMPEVRIDATIPEGTPVSADTSSGNVSLHGPLGPCAVDTNYGEVDIADVDGNVRAATRSGSMSVSRVRAAKEIDLRSGYGSLRVSEAEAERARFETTSGDVSIRDVKSQETSARSSYGRLSIQRVTGAVTAKTTSGDVTLEEAAKGAHSLESGYGNITVRKAEGSLRSSTSSGNISIRDFVGKAEATSNYGNVEIVGVLSGAQGRSSSGNVRAVANEGSAADSDWSLHSGYGNVVIELPADFRCRLDAKTSYGSIDTDFSVVLDAGTKLKGGWMRGSINLGEAAGAAPRVALQTSSGDIKILKSSR
jgi:DUF4097 and DUF4098 domain-containing protein YvlB